MVSRPGGIQTAESAGAICSTITISFTPGRLASR